MSKLVDKIKDKVGGNHSSGPNPATSHVKLVGKPIGPIGYGLMGQ
jgi:hypothetical protein